MNPSSMRNMMSRKGSNKLFNSSVNTDDNMTYDFDDEPSSSNISTKSYSTNVNSDSRVETNENTKLLGSVAKETLAIKRIRVLLLLTLLVASTGIVIVTYFTAKSNESSQFNSTYESLTSKLATSITDIQYQQIGQMVSFAVAVESYGMNNRNSSGGWPFVTIPQFHELADIVLGSSNALYVALSPLVTDKSLHLWKRYVGINNRDFSESIFYQNEGGEEIIDPGPGPYMPIRQTSPSLRSHDLTNMNILRSSSSARDAKLCLDVGSIVFGNFQAALPGNTSSNDFDSSLYATLLNAREERRQRNHGMGSLEYHGDPMSPIYIPIFDSFQESRNVVGIASFLVQWSKYFTGVLPTNAPSIVCVLDNQCREPYSFEIQGQSVQFLGQGDLHENKFDSFEKTQILMSQDSSISDGSSSGLKVTFGDCPTVLRFYPSEEFYDMYHTHTPVTRTVATAVALAVIILLFALYNYLVEKRQKNMSEKTFKSSEIASSFLKTVPDKITEQATGYNNERSRLKAFLGTSNEYLMQPTIADLFPHTTVMLSDISGFTAWSSTREPAQVFFLLQTVYHEFDIIAKKRQVFKVETVGDSYVAVAGLPDPQPDHAVIMGRFASDCLHAMIMIARDLETKLGPDTGELCMRFGLHSGPVTAGVLSGERARFQLFGDTVNTASRMESTGHRNMIQVSESTARHIVEAGKGHWLTPRADQVQVKGKGALSTFWLNPHAFKGAHEPTADNSEKNQESSEMPRRRSETTSIKKGMKRNDPRVRKDRLVEWIYVILLERLRAIVATRDPSMKKNSSNSAALVWCREPGKTPLDEITETIALPKFSEVNKTFDCETVSIDKKTLKELRCFTEMIAALYPDNPFHNIEHAAHVTMSVTKLLSRIVAPDLGRIDTSSDDIASNLYDYTHGINSDPITLLAIVFSALIHDTDHRGVSNAQLIKEEQSMAMMYRGKSVAEQNSLDLAWNLLMSDQFNNLRKCMFTTEGDLKRFRQVVVNVVLATDIFDQELNALRKKRWDKAFSSDVKQIPAAEVNNLRATIVMEHLIQASDVAHTMQHWHVYRKWNRNLFNEMLTAHRSGRMAADPCQFWYQGELNFFDNYIIPLANKLKECQVFGVCSDEYLNYAVQNRAEWEARGQEIVEEMITEFITSYPVSSDDEEIID